MLLAACVPVRITGYEPSGVGEQMSWARAGWGCLAGVNDVLRTETKAGVVMFTNASRGYKDQIGLRIRLVIPPGVTVRLLSADFTAESADWEKAKTLSIRSVNGRIPYSEELHGAPGNAGIFDFWFSNRAAETELPEVETLRLRFPLLAINNETYQPSDVVFRAMTEWGIGWFCT